MFSSRNWRTASAGLRGPFGSPPVGAHQQRGLPHFVWRSASPPAVHSGANINSSFPSARLITAASAWPTSTRSAGEPFLASVDGEVVVAHQRPSVGVRRGQRGRHGPARGAPGPSRRGGRRAGSSADTDRTAVSACRRASALGRRPPRPGRESLLRLRIPILVSKSWGRFAGIPLPAGASSAPAPRGRRGRHRHGGGPVRRARTATG